MNIFNSLGSNYDLKYLYWGIVNLFAKSKQKDLIDLLKKRFNAEVQFFYKGREAIEAALLISNLRKGDFVAITGFTCYVVEKAVVNAGFNCTYLDIDDSLNFSPKTLNKALKKNPKIKAVIIQNTLGNRSDIVEISKICKKNNLLFIEDMAHFIGSGLADLSALSFSQDKIIDSVSGGALIIHNDIYLKNIGVIQRKNIKQKVLIKDILYPYFTYLIRLTYPVGLGKILHYILKGLNLLSTPIEIDDEKLHSLPRWHTNMAFFYLSNLDFYSSHRKIISQIYLNRNLNKKEVHSVFLRFPIFTGKRASLIIFLRNHGVYLSDTWFDWPVAPIKYKEITAYKTGTCPNADKIIQEIVNLPTHLNVSENDAIKICELINKWVNIK